MMKNATKYLLAGLLVLGGASACSDEADDDLTASESELRGGNQVDGGKEKPNKDEDADGGKYKKPKKEKKDKDGGKEKPSKDKDGGADDEDGGEDEEDSDAEVDESADAGA